MFRHVVFVLFSCIVLNNLMMNFVHAFQTRLTTPSTVVVVVGTKTSLVSLSSSTTTQVSTRIIENVVQDGRRETITKQQQEQQQQGFPLIASTPLRSTALAAPTITPKNKNNGMTSTSSVVPSTIFSTPTVSVMSPSSSSSSSSSSSMMNSPAEAFESLVQKGEANAKASVQKTFVSSVLGGGYVGIGSTLSLAVAGNSQHLDPGMQKFIFAALFPMNLLLTLQCGGQLYTGNTASMMAAVCEKRASWRELQKSWSVSWIGNLCGCLLAAMLTKYSGVLEGGASEMATKLLISKTSVDFGPIIVKAMFCNWLVCLAVYLSLQAKDMSGKYLSIWLPVSTFVSIGFEHSVANMFLLPVGLMSSYTTSDICTLPKAILCNLLPVTVGNAISGSLLVGVTLSYMYGTLGDEQQQQQQQQ